MSDRFGGSFVVRDRVGGYSSLRRCHADFDGNNSGLGYSRWGTPYWGPLFVMSNRCSIVDHVGCPDQFLLVHLRLTVSMFSWDSFLGNII